MRILEARIFACPKCSRKFKTMRHLNTHLTLKHAAKWKLEIVSESTPPQLRMKRRGSRK